MTSALPYLALTMGAMSSFHCVGMCGPIALALPTQRGNKVRQFVSLTTYNLGRTITYATLGILLGSVGSSIAWIGYLRYLSVFSGVLMIAYVLWPSRLDIYFHPPKLWKRFVQKLKSRMGKMLLSPALMSRFALGILNGLLPCGLVYLALVSSVATGNPLSGGLFMLLFGIGTLPAMMAVGFFKQWFTNSLRTKMRFITPVFMAIAGLFLVMRGLLIEYPLTQTNQASSITICHGK